MTQFRSILLTNGEKAREKVARLLNMILRSNQNKYKNNNKIVQNSKSEKTEKSMTSQLPQQPIILRSVSVYIYFDQSKSKEEGGEAAAG